MSTQKLVGEEQVPCIVRGQFKGRQSQLLIPKLSNPSLKLGIMFQCSFVHCSRPTVSCPDSIPFVISKIFSCTSKYLGVADKFARNVISMLCMDNPIMNMFSLLGTKTVSGGSDCLMVVSVEMMVVLLSVCEIMLAKPTIMTMIIARESSPPVKVLYCVSQLYLRS